MFKNSRLYCQCDETFSFDSERNFSNETFSEYISFLKFIKSLASSYDAEIGDALGESAKYSLINSFKFSFSFCKFNSPGKGCSIARARRSVMLKIFGRKPGERIKKLFFMLSKRRFVLTNKVIFAMYSGGKLLKRWLKPSTNSSEKLQPTLLANIFCDTSAIVIFTPAIFLLCRGFP